MAIFGDVCTYGILYSVGLVARLGDRPGSVQKAEYANVTQINHVYLLPVMAIFGDVCTYGILYLVGQVARPGEGPGSV